MAVGAFIKTATFSDGTSVSFCEDDIVVFVGANNAGKSAALRSLYGLFLGQHQNAKVVTRMERSTRGAIEEVFAWLENTSYVYRDPDNLHFSGYGQSVNAQNVRHWWENYRGGLGQLGNFFCQHLTTEQRLTVVHPPPNISLTSSPPQHPIHYMQRDDSIEKRVSELFYQAFAFDLIIHHNSGADVPLYMGNRPKLDVGEDRISSRYLRELEQLPKLHEQGDGMRSFAGVLLHAIIGRHTLTLIDEPEAFLHPPQARLLGRMLAKETPNERQVFIATHSADVLQGLLDANRGNVRVIRLTRKGNINYVRELQTADVKQLWSDPLLRHSDIFSGLFHEKVVVCESDADCRFYAAILDSLLEDAVLPRRDVMFVHCGGKGRIPTVVRALRAVGVPVCAVADFDVLNDENPLHPIYESLGGTWNDLVADWKLVKSSIESKKRELDAGEVRKELETILRSVEGASFPKHATQQIHAILRRSSPWATAKTTGMAFVPAGDPHNACSRLFERLASVGLFVVELGELEGFAKSIGGHGPEWVNGVLPKVVGRDPEISPAREFVKRIVL